MHEEVEAKLHTLSTSIFGGDEYWLSYIAMKIGMI
jgi:hypothetical protein